MSPALFTCGKNVLSSPTGYSYTNKDVNKSDADATTTTLYFAQEPVIGVYSVDEENKRFLVAIKPNGEENEECLFAKYSREDYPSAFALADPVTIKNTRLTLNYVSPIGSELQTHFAKGMRHKSIVEWATQIDIDGKANYAQAKREKEASNNADQPLAPLNCPFGEQRNSSLSTSIFKGSTFSDAKDGNKGSSICSADIDECEPMRYTSRDSFDSIYLADWEESGASSISGFSFQHGGDEINVSPEWSHDELPLSKQQQESLSIAIIEDDKLTISENTTSPSATSIAPSEKRVRFSIHVRFSLLADEREKEPHTTTYNPPLNNKRNSEELPILNNHQNISAIDLPGYAFLAKPLQITHSTIHSRWFLKSELDQRTLYRNMCAAYNCHCSNYCQGIALRRWKLLDDGYSWVPKDEQVHLVKTAIPQLSSFRSFWSRFRITGAPQYTTPSEFRTQLEDSKESGKERVNAPNESLLTEYTHLKGIERGDRLGTDEEILFYLERGEDGNIRMRVMSDEEMAEARELQKERRGKFLVFEGNEEGNSGLMKLARYLEKGGEMVTFLCR